MAWAQKPAVDSQELNAADISELSKLAAKGIQGCKVTDMAFSEGDVKNKTDEHIDKSALFQAIEKELRAAKISLAPSGTTSSLQAEISSIARQSKGLSKKTYTLKLTAKGAQEGCTAKSEITKTSGSTVK